MLFGKKEEYPKLPQLSEAPKQSPMEPAIEEEEKTSVPEKKV